MPARKEDAALADDGVVAVWQLFDEVVREGDARGLFDLARGGVGATVSDVVAHGVVKEHRLLRDDGEMRAQTVEPRVAQVRAIPEHRAAGRIVEARD